PEILENTEKLLEQCSIYFELGQDVEPKNQRCYTGNEELDFRLMRKLAYAGMKYRYRRPGKRIFNRLEKELEIIRDKGFVSYFLINWKILKYARSKGYFYVGRGSGANSIVAYLLRITDVDPVELDLYFERFINLYRKNPPDFDIDFSWTDRDDVTRFIFERFPNSSLLAVYNTFQYKAVVRELGKVFGLPKHEIDVLSSGKFDVSKLDHLNKLVLQYGSLIQGFPNHLSIHAAGILISEKPIHYYTATFMPPKGYPTTQFDMIVAEDVGLYKFDILSQRGLGKIKDTLDVIRYNHPKAKPIDIHDIHRFKRDPRVKELLRNAKAIGCFYVESPAMRMLLKKLQVDNYLGLVAASSVIRPGVAKSGMMREYILRYRYPEKRKEAHPVMQELMPETYGVMVYQEDVIKVAHFFAGLSLGEADMLRRGMSGKFRSREEFAKVKRKFFENCEEKGHSRTLTEEVWRQTESFAGYAFAKGHSASYAVESYQSLFLKAYYPLEYMVATINNFGGFYRTELYVHEARMHGADICAPCVNRSRYETVIIDKEIFLGFILLHQLEIKTAKQIVAEREQNGAFADFNDFVTRVPISVEQASILIRINAFRFTEKDKRTLLWEAHFKLDKKPPKEFEPDLFRLQPKEFKIPTLENVNYADAFDEMEIIGFPLNNPFTLLVEQPKEQVLAKDLVNHKGKFVTVTGYLVTVKNTMTAGGKKMHFGAFLDHEGQWLDTVHFPPVAERYPFRGRGVYTVVGKVMEEFDCYSIEVEKMYKSAIIEDPRYSEKSLSA
ncbi:MAG: DNA polymerase III subunit alpha, partial [Schleiferiaceae bacterium]|nr:DNA polymerase III subunit alpha [Schleiferiaceae bacterium]